MARCPSDDVDSRVRLSFGIDGTTPEPYRYSYVVNQEMPSTRTLWHRSLAVRNASRKVLLIEEDERTISEGCFRPTHGGLGSASNYVENLLATRHDPARRTGMPTWPLSPLDRRPDRNERGNAGFVDGHVDYVTRAYSWDPRHYLPGLD